MHFCVYDTIIVMVHDNVSEGVSMGVGVRVGGPYQSHKAVLKWNLAVNYHFSEGLMIP